MIKWKEISGFPDYLVSDNGEVFSKRHGKILKPYNNYKGYEKVQLYVDGRSYKKRIHRLVAEAFINNPEHLPEVNHKDLNKHNNAVSNLEWVTGEENRKHYQRWKANESACSV